ncbi:hypothetical protein [Geomesophilobacter sediminis]|uniref:DUF5666 domain-containing protein n=1 Tax=Geomesophilobacter sediminis TaxID=2798584 RepID=A0A8J7M0I2_9BACT|nr:hypothetical protein [Geomesophilobacter sediminis]MBJ6725322.1 hypothetical protein [Geomesophilobacter sediminis]
MKYCRFFLIFLLLALTAGCGADWFPEYHQSPTDPNVFSFDTQTNVALGSVVKSNTITVQGLKAASTTITISDTTGSGSQYSINGGAFTSANGTVKNGDTVTVQHTASSTVGGVVVTTVTIGNIAETFTSIVSNVQPLFSPITKQAAAGKDVDSGLVTLNITPGSYVVSITNGLFSTNATTGFTAISQSITFSSPAVIYLRNTAPSTVGQSVVTTLTVGNQTGTMTTTAQ